MTCASFQYYWSFVMTTSSNGNTFRVTDPLCGEFIGHRWIPLTKASDAELWYFLWSAPWIHGWVNNRDAGDYDVIVMWVESTSHRWRPCMWRHHNVWLSHWVNAKMKIVNPRRSSIIGHKYHMPLYIVSDHATLKYRHRHGGVAIKIDGPPVCFDNLKSKPSQIAKFMEPTWGPPGSCRPQMGPMMAPWTLLSGLVTSAILCGCKSVDSRSLVTCCTWNYWTALHRSFNF